MGWRKLVSFSSGGQVAGSCQHCNGLRTPKEGEGMFLRNAGNHLQWHNFTSQTPGIHGSEPSGSMKCGIFLNSWGTTTFLRRIPFNKLVILECSDATLTSQFYIYNTTCYLPTTMWRLLPVMCQPLITAVMIWACVKPWNNSNTYQHRPSLPHIYDLCHRPCMVLTYICASVWEVTDLRSDLCTNLQPVIDTFSSTYAAWCTTYVLSSFVTNRSNCVFLYSESASVLKLSCRKCSEGGSMSMPECGSMLELSCLGVW